MLLTSYFARSAREPGAVSIARFPPNCIPAPGIQPVSDLHSIAVYRDFFSFNQICDKKSVQFSGNWYGP